tara:strand:+ start:918 stop:1316 length:399 start_codon:yes stop_codon:yes gene_type:complete
MIENLNELFFQLSLEKTATLLYRFAIIPLSALLIFYISFLIIIRIKFLKPTNIADNFYLNFQFSRLHAVNFTTLLLNGFWFYLLWNYDIKLIEWGFLWEITNIYLQLAPFILSNIILFFIHSRSNKLITKIL